MVFIIIVVLKAHDIQGNGPLISKEGQGIAKQLS